MSTPTTPNAPSAAPAPHTPAFTAPRARNGGQPARWPYWLAAAAIAALVHLLGGGALWGSGALDGLSNGLGIGPAAPPEPVRVSLAAPRPPPTASATPPERRATPRPPTASAPASSSAAVSAETGAGSATASPAPAADTLAPATVPGPAGSGSAVAAGDSAAASAVPDPGTTPLALAAAAAAPAAPAPRVDEPDAQAAPMPAVTRLPPPGQWLYTVQGQARGFPYRANASLDLRLEGVRYQATLEIWAFLIGSRAQASSGQVGTGGLLPEQFADRTRRDRVTAFDRERGQIRFEGDTTLEGVPDRVQDRLSVLLQLGAWCASLDSTSRPAPGRTWTLAVAGTRALERWTFRVDGDETLDLTPGPLGAWKLTREPRRAEDQRIELWLAPTLGCIPARVRITDPRGDRVDQQLRQWPTGGAAPRPLAH